MAFGEEIRGFQDNEEEFKKRKEVQVSIVKGIEQRWEAKEWKRE